MLSLAKNKTNDNKILLQSINTDLFSGFGACLTSWLPTEMVKLIWLKFLEISWIGSDF